MYSYSWGHFSFKKKDAQMAAPSGYFQEYLKCTRYSCVPFSEHFTKHFDHPARCAWSHAGPAGKEEAKVEEALSVPSQSAFPKYQEGGNWPFLVNTDGLGIILSFYFKRIQTEPDLQLETCGKSPVLRELAVFCGAEWLLSPSSGPALSTLFKVPLATSFPERLCPPGSPLFSHLCLCIKLSNNWLSALVSLWEKLGNAKIL